MFLWIFTPKPWGNDPIWRSHIFQGVCWNHQLVLVTLFSQRIFQLLNWHLLKGAFEPQRPWRGTYFSSKHLFKNTSIHLQKPPELSECLCETKHIFWESVGMFFFRKNMGSRSIPSSQNQLQESLNFGRRPRPSTASTTSIHSRAQVSHEKRAPGLKSGYLGGFYCPVV